MILYPQSTMVPTDHITPIATTIILISTALKERKNRKRMNAVSTKEILQEHLQLIRYLDGHGCTNKRQATQAYFRVLLFLEGIGQLILISFTTAVRFGN